MRILVWLGIALSQFVSADFHNHRPGRDEPEIGQGDLLGDVLAIDEDAPAIERNIRNPRFGHKAEHTTIRVQPDPTTTPGARCTTTDPDYDHTAHYKLGDVVICKRHITPAMRRQVFAAYGIPVNRQGRFELDHRIPLCAGGSNSIENLWPEPWADADAKDVIEKRACAGLRAGRLTQDQAVKMVLER